jgi:hypothetical protein
MEESQVELGWEGGEMEDETTGELSFQDKDEGRHLDGN